MRSFTVWIQFICYIHLWSCASSETDEPINAELIADSEPMIEPVAGESVAGESVAGELVAGELVAGELVAGELVAGELVAGELVAGESVAGESIDCDQLSPCGSRCVDVMSDPNNCGGCGRTCIIPNATARCLAGQCDINQCLGEYQDVDAQLSNGCESLNACIPNISCLSVCGSEGNSSCIDDITECEPPSESCNLQDDDCDGACDEGWADLNCRVGIHRGYGRGEHIYSTELALVTSDGHSLERENFFYVYSETQANTRPVFYCKTSANRPFLSNQTDCGINRAPIQTLGFWLAETACGASPLYFLTKDTDADFFYTTSASERDYAVTLGYVSQGIAGYIWLP